MDSKLRHLERAVRNQAVLTGEPAAKQALLELAAELPSLHRPPPAR